MNRLRHRGAALTVVSVLALASISMGATRSTRVGKYLTLEGAVLRVNAQERTMLVSDLWSKTLYLVHVPAEGGFRITFGMNMKSAYPEFRDVHRNDRVRMRCTRSEDRLARLSDGREVVVLTAAN